jgi:murein DD-endopeptidase MepM/ murein hydrolase activator NlpD
MNENGVFFLYKLRFIFAGVLIVAGLFMLSFLLQMFETVSAQAQDTKPAVYAAATDMSYSPNVVTGAMGAAAGEFMKSLDSKEITLNSNIKALGTEVALGGKRIAGAMQHYGTAAGRGLASGGAFIGRAIGSGIMFASHKAADSVVFVLRIPGKILGYISNTRLVSAVIKPADHNEVPIIDPDSPALKAALNTMPAEQTLSATNTRTDKAAAWPMHGRVTTEFGVPHWPYQRTHTGMDISSGQASGVTPIKPFRPGRVTEAAYSRRGLGNHVVVDHGNGVTSVYSHLKTISVRAGQEVNKSTTLGYEGSTGVSTGTHLHFEIRVNGQAANPRLFISGQP